MTNDYDDIINLPHYEPKHHPRMSMWNRAAQFAPFAALTGYDAAIQESGRLTDDWLGLSESGNEEMTDRHKAGGSYQSYTGNVKRIDEYEKHIEFTDGKKVPLDAISEIKIDDHYSITSI